MNSKSNPKPNYLVVCGQNKRRSRTAEYIYKNDQRFNIRSVGLSPKSKRKIQESDINWATLILTMEDRQTSRIQEQFRYLKLPSIETLYIDDVYDYLQPELIQLIKESFESLADITD